MINGYVITLDTSQESIEASHKCIGSICNTKSEIDPSVFVATVPRQIKRHLEEIDMGDVVWTYPLTKEEDGLDIKTGLYLRHYPTKKISNRTACAVSHMRLWHKCATHYKRPIIILEHDAIFTRKFVFEPLEEEFKGGILGLNDPRGATRRSNVFHNVASSKMGLQPVPTVDDELAQRLYEYVSQKWFMFASPVLSNAPNGTGKSKGMPISCFLTYVPDTLEGLIGHTSELRWLSVYGGGVGGHWSDVRTVSDIAPGPMPFLHTVDADMIAYRQGKTRKGSYAAYMDISHPDILEFLNMRIPTGDVQRKALNLHNAINISDEFYDRSNRRYRL